MLRKFLLAGRKVLALFMVLLLCLPLTGCWDSEELEELAFVIALGIDKSDVPNLVKLTAMIAIPAKIAGGAGGGGGGGEGGGKQEENVSVVTINCASLFAGLNLMNSFVSRKLNLQYMKAIVVGEEMAREGISKNLGAMMRYHQVRRTTMVIVARPSAEEFINKLKPKLGTSPSKYLEDAMLMFETSALLPKVFYHNFLQQYQSYGDEPYALLGTVVKRKKKATAEDRLMAETRSESPGIAAATSRKGGIDISLVGAAVFRGDRLAGYLSGDETRVFNLLRGDLRQAFFALEDPLSPGKMVVVDVRQGSPPRVKVDLSGEQPRVKVQLSLEGDLVGHQSQVNYVDNFNNRARLERAVAAMLEKRSANLIRRAQEEFGTDIFGFGRRGAQYQFLTWQDWVNYHWKDRFPAAEVKVEVKFRIRRIGLQYGPARPGEGV
ncbi:MAG: spore germination protein [Eubacteriales bacterium]|nr:spore germination protein [Eubacteriales bacterium]